MCICIFLIFAPKIKKMKCLFSFYIIFLCFVFVSNAQTEKEVLFTIDGKEYEVDAFLNSYQKNSDISSSESVEDHLERFINFNLKLTSAYENQMDTLSSFKQEFGRYYKQIADNYISNGEVTEKMVKETYDRTKTEIRASHILLNLPDSENDTSAVYQKALMIKERLENGEDFESLAKEYSDDPSVKANGGDMNWFNTFKMVYEFENAAYNLEVGEISKPVKTEFGYHIIKKTGERPSKGKLETAHIMLLPGDSLQDPEMRIQKIYKRLQDGEDFHELAKQYSQDPNTARSGGYVPAFSLGGLNSKVYENKTYELGEVGDFTEPFKTRFGWHIVKLIKITPLEPYDEVKAEYKKKLKSSSRSKVLMTKIKENLENLYKVEINPEAKDYFLNVVDSSFAEADSTYKTNDKLKSGYVIKVEDRTIDYKTFGEYLERKQFGNYNSNNQKEIVNDALDEMVYKELLAYHKIKLPEIDKEFAKQIEEFKNGILIFDYMKSKIWEPISEDTLSQKEFYNNNKTNFEIPKKINGQLYTSKSKKSLKALETELKKRSSEDTLAIEVPQEVIVEEVSLDQSSSKLPKKFKFENGLSKIYKHSDQFLIMNVSEVIDARIPEFDKVTGKIISILQEKKEEELISELRKNHDVVIDNGVFKELKDRLEK